MEGLFYYNNSQNKSLHRSNSKDTEKSGMDRQYPTLLIFVAFLPFETPFLKFLIQQSGIFKFIAAAQQIKFESHYVWKGSDFKSQYNYCA